LKNFLNFFPSKTLNNSLSKKTSRAHKEHARKSSSVEYLSVVFSKRREKTSAVFVRPHKSVARLNVRASKAREREKERERVQNHHPKFFLIVLVQLHKEE
jgi:hypothetical protein